MGVRELNKLHELRIGRKLWVGGIEHRRFTHRLRDQETVEWVTVMVRKGLNPQGGTHIYGKLDEAAFPRRFDDFDRGDTKI